MTWLVFRRVLGFVGAHWRACLILGLMLALGVMSSANTRLRTTVRAQAACVVAAKGDLNARPVGEVCAPSIAQAITAERRSRSCDHALGAGGANFDCTPAVRQLADRAAADADSLSSAKAALAATTLETHQAVARAEARGAAQAERTARAQAARDGAPVDGAGLRVYDAERLRQRWGQAQH